MHKNFWAGLVTLGLCFLVGCGNSNNDKADTSQTDKTGNESYLEDARGNDIYEMETKEYKEGSFSLEYPQFSESSNTDFTEKWNKFIEETTLSHMRVVKKASEDIIVDEGQKLPADDSCCDIKYEIKTKNKEIISILCHGQAKVRAAAHPSNILYTYNINLLTGQSIRLKESKNFSKHSESIFYGKNYSYVKDLLEGEDYSNDIKEWISGSYNDVSSLTNDLKEYDFDIDKKYDFENGDMPLGYSYYENNKMVICMPVIHALGDYVQLIME